jgi:hypothetical protein
MFSVSILSRRVCNLHSLLLHCHGGGVTFFLYVPDLQTAIRLITLKTRLFFLKVECIIPAPATACSPGGRGTAYFG